MAQDPAHYDAVIADLEERRDQMNGMIEMLKQMKAGGPLNPVASSSSMPITVMGADIAHDAFFGMTIPEAAKKYLSIVRRTTPHPALCDALLDGGFKTTATNFREVVRSTLGRNPEFVKISGQWGLNEWYGNRGTRKSKRTPSPTEEVQGEIDTDSEEKEEAAEAKGA